MGNPIPFFMIGDSGRSQNDYIDCGNTDELRFRLSVTRMATGRLAVQ